MSAGSGLIDVGVASEHGDQLFVRPPDAPERYTLRELRSRGGEGELWSGTAGR